MTNKNTVPSLLLALITIITNKLFFLCSQPNNDGDQQANEIDPDLYDSDGNFDKISAQTKAMKSFRLREQSLRCPALDENPIFKRLRSRLIKFYLEQERYRKEGPTAK